MEAHILIWCRWYTAQDASLLLWDRLQERGQNQSITWCFLLYLSVLLYPTLISGDNTALNHTGFSFIYLESVLGFKPERFLEYKIPMVFCSDWLKSSKNKVQNISSLLWLIISTDICERPYFQVDNQKCSKSFSNHVFRTKYG